MKKLEVVILHGWAISGQNKAKWQPFMDLLANMGISSTFLSIPGMDSELTKPWSLSDYVTWLDQELSQKKSCILIGHSFGGQLAVRYSALHPQKIAKLVLIASAGIRDHSFKAALKRNVFFVLAKVGKRLSTQPAMRTFLYKIAREHDYEQASPVMKKTMQLITADEIRDDISNITCPVQLVWGVLDASTPYANVEVFLAALPTAEVCTINSARHAPQFTHPEQTADCVAEFITGK